MKRSEKGRNLRIQISDYTVIDLETTGRDITQCEVIEMAAVRIRDGKISDTFSELVRPSQPIPDLITQLTGISNIIVANAENCESVLKRFLAFIGSDIVVGHNILTFDTNMIYDLSVRYYNKPFQNDMIDTFQYARYCSITPPNYKLTTLSAFFGIQHDNAHRALGDCMATYHCYEAMKPLLSNYASAVSGGGEYERKSHHKVKPSKVTEALHELRSLIQISLCDGILTDDEILEIQEWMTENRQLEGAYPYDIIFDKLSAILADGIISDDERNDLIALMEEQFDPVTARSEEIEVNFKEKNICLTGDFISGSRAEIEQLFTEMGAAIGKNVTSKTDYLIVGGCGSAAWSCGNYGNKVKKALELQEKGKPIKIIREDVAMKCLNMNG